MSRLQRYTAQLHDCDMPCDELTARRLHSRGLQQGRIPDALAARLYEREAMATAHVVTEEDFQNANS